MEPTLLYKDQKCYHYVDNRFEAIRKVAIRSQQRYLMWGAVAALAWIGYVAKLPPIQKARTIWPHIITMVVGASIAKTVECGYKNARRAEQETNSMIAELKRCRNHDDIIRILEKNDSFEKKYARFAQMADTVQERDY